MDEPTYSPTDIPEQPLDDTPPGDSAERESVLATPGQPTTFVTEEKVLVFEDLTLSQALHYLFWRPGQTARLFWQVLTRDVDESARESVEPPPDDDEWEPPDEPEPIIREEPRPAEEESPVEEISHDLSRWLWVGLMALVTLLAIRGGYVLYDAATDMELHAKRETNDAALWFVLAGSLVVGVEMVRARHWWVRRFGPISSWFFHTIAESDFPWLWNTLLGLFMVLLTWLAIVGALGTIGSAILLALAAAIWLVVLLGNTPRQAVSEDVGAARSDVVLPGDDAYPMSGFWGWFQAHAARLLLMPPALLLSALAYSENVTRNADKVVTNVELTTYGFIAWVASVLLWMVILGVDVNRLPIWVQEIRFRRPHLRLERVRWWVVVGLLVVIALGAYFRLYDLESTPPEMTSDHIEKLLDALRVNDGSRAIFFPNNGGREGFQMYLVALIANLGAGFSFNALKLATVIEGLITLPLLWWMARQVIGTDTEDDRQLGHWVGLALAGLVAVNGWHVMLSRLGLRIVLTPLTTALVIGFLARAMRHNRMRDYLALGFTLGVGIYFYQANRMLPLLAVAGIGLALMSKVRGRRDAVRMVGEGLGFVALVIVPLGTYWYITRVLQQTGYNHTREAGERMASFMPMAAMLWFGILTLALRARRHEVVLQYGGGLLATAVVALAIYIPMYHYSELYPDDYWNRTRGRMFGEDAFLRFDPAVGHEVAYEPTLSEQAERFWDQRAVFDQNYRDALRMYHWEGDGAWINNARSRPALGPIAGGLVILGVVIWGVWVFRRRDPVDWLIPAGLLIMLLPSAMTLAYTIENPSFTRASGTVPTIFMFAALPLGLLCWRVSHLSRYGWGRVVVGIIALVILTLVPIRAIQPDWDNFFEAYRLHYVYSWKPYSVIAAPLREFAQGQGSYGNAFMVAYPHWLDHRILGTMAGDIRWPNGLVDRQDIYAMIARNRNTPYEYDPGRPLFFMYHLDDIETRNFLEANFPGGFPQVYEYTYESEGGEATEAFNIYIVWAGWIG